MRVFSIGPHPTVPQKGTGWFATVDIMRGTPLLAEEALFEVPEKYTVAMINARRHALPQNDQQQFNALTVSKGTSTPKRIFDTNTFDLSSDQQNQKTKGLFLETARLNHSCKPNAHWTWNPELSRLTVYAMMNIPMNDEITISYLALDDFQTRSERNVQLEEYNFECQCEACQPGMPFGIASDERRLRLKQLQHDVDNKDYLPSEPYQRLHDISEMGDKLRQEQLVYPMLGKVCHFVAEWYKDRLLDNTTWAASYKEGNRRRALKWARDELVLDLACTGHKSHEVTEALTFIRQLKGQ